MIKIRDDELIHGYLVRVLTIARAIQQPKDLSVIISNSGVIRELPMLNDNQRQYFTHLTLQDISHILSHNTPYLYTGTTISNLVDGYVFKGWVKTCK